MRGKLVILAFMAVLAISGCQKKDGNGQKRPPAGVTTMKIKLHDTNLSLTSTGTTEASQYVQIRARVDGYLDAIDYREGSLVSKGQTLFRLDPKPLEAALNITKASLASAVANHENAKRNLDRAKPLFEANVMSRQDYDNAISQELVTKAALQSAEAAVDSAQLNFGYTTIKSPVTGLSDKAAVHVGNYISPTQNGLLTTVSQIDPIYINFQMSENQYLSINQAKSSGKIAGVANIISVKMGDGMVYGQKGKLAFCSPSFDTNTGTMNCRAEVKNPDGKIRPGEFVRVTLDGTALKSAILIPQKALLQGQKGRFVYVIKDGKAVMTPVVLGDWIGDDVIILQGLKEGDLLAVDGVVKVMPNADVKIIGEANTSLPQPNMSK
jgi:membrane fusion protein (multidrug efflux system)